MRRTLGNVEMQFADIVWSNAPLRAGELCKICEKELSWNRVTTYTVLRKLSNEGLFCNDGGTVKVLITKDEYISEQSVDYVQTNFNGSLPGFVTAFSRGRGLSVEEAEELLELINSVRRDKTEDV